MNKIQTFSINSGIVFASCIAILLINGISYAADGQYPMKVEIIDKDQARYDTPENAYVALCSAIIKEDLQWVYETLTRESAEETKRLFEETGTDPRKIFKLGGKGKQTFIIDKREYENAVLLLIEHKEKEGTITRIPVTFVIEHGAWKRTNKFASDENLWEYLDYIKPEEIISSTTTIRPNR